jgi:hypothetical protein
MPLLNPSTKDYIFSKPQIMLFSERRALLQPLAMKIPQYHSMMSSLPVPPFAEYVFRPDDVVVSPIAKDVLTTTDEHTGVITVLITEVCTPLPCDAGLAPQDIDISHYTGGNGDPDTVVVAVGKPFGFEPGAPSASRGGGRTFTLSDTTYTQRVLQHDMPVAPSEALD